MYKMRRRLAEGISVIDHENDVEDIICSIGQMTQIRRQYQGERFNLI